MNIMDCDSCAHQMLAKTANSTFIKVCYLCYREDSGTHRVAYKINADMNPWCEYKRERDYTCEQPL